MIINHELSDKDKYFWQWYAEQLKKPRTIIAKLLRHWHYYVIFLLAVALVIVGVAECVMLYMVIYNKTMAQLMQRIFPLPPLIDTKVCHLEDWPVFDDQTLALFENKSNSPSPCQEKPPFVIRRVNFTWIEIQYPNSTDNSSEWICRAADVNSGRFDYFAFGKMSDKLGRLTNFAYNKSKGNPNFGPRFESVMVVCAAGNQTYSKVIPLVQEFHRHKQVKTSKPPVNVILLGIDSVSRLQFLRHFPLCKRFFDSHQFIPMYGYHKVHENSFPNVLPILSGFPKEHLVSGKPNFTFTFDNVPLIHREFRKYGYLTTYIEDMPPYGFFSFDQAGFVKKPTDYYLRPTNWAIWQSIYSGCYQEKFEIEHYYEYILDQLNAFRARGNQSYFIFNHESEVTHNYLNYAGYMDRPLHTFLQKIFHAGHHQNTVIVVFADHSFRMGGGWNDADIYEKRLPMFYMYLPETLTLNGRNVSELRQIVRGNQHRLTSHFDLHATMMHLLTGQTQSYSRPYGKSLLEEIPEDRTCDMAGILPQYCLCNSFQPIKVTSEVNRTSALAVDHINSILASQAGNSCVPLTLQETHRAYSAASRDRNEIYQIVKFATAPNDGFFEAMVIFNQGNTTVQYVSRLNLYGSQSACVGNNRELVHLCLCRDVFEDKILEERRKRELWDKINSINNDSQ